MKRTTATGALAGLAALLAVTGTPVRATAAQAPWELTLEPSKLLGSCQYAAGVVEIGWGAGLLPGGHLSHGFHYVERGSFLAQALFAAIAGAGAGFEAQRTGKDQEYTLDVSPRSLAAIRLDLMTGADDSGALVFDLFYGLPYGEDDSPWVLDFGVSLGSVKTPEYAADKSLNHGDGHMFAGLMAGAVLPVTRFAQAEGIVRLTANAPYWNVELGGVANLGNRLFVRLRGLYMDDLTTSLNVGVRL